MSLISSARRFSAPAVAAVVLAAFLVSCASSPSPHHPAAAPAGTGIKPAPPTQGRGRAVEPLPKGWTAGSASVKVLRGGADASYRVGDGPWRPLLEGQMLHEGDALRTGADVICDMTLRQNGPVIRVVPETTLRFERLRFKQTNKQVIPETILALEAGRIQGSVGGLPDGSVFLVKLPNGMAQVFSQPAAGSR
jgi:hypothetical protein